MVGGIGKYSGFDSASISQYRQNMFNKIDADGNGSITKSELEAVAGSTTSNISIADLISALDSDGDGAISKSESDAALNAAEQRMGLGDFSSNLNMAGGSGRLNNSSVSSADDFFSAIDTNGDDSIDTTEMQTFLTENGMEFDQAIFDSIDADSDGVISKSEMETMRANMAPPPPPPNEESDTSQAFDTLFSAIDTSGDDSIDATEMKSFLTGNGMTFDQTVFDSLDADGNGAISKNEANAAAQANMQAQMPPPPPSAAGEEESSLSADTLFSAIDTNGDGVIDKSELEAYMEESMTSEMDTLTEDLDTDGDGKISRTEAETARLKIQEQFVDELLSNGSTNKIQFEQMLDAYANIFNSVSDDNSGGSLSITA